MTRIKPRPCPKCGRLPILYTEVWSGHVIVFDANADGTAVREGTLHEGEPIGVEAKCSCGNEWKLRGITQIIAVRED